MLAELLPMRAGDLAEQEVLGFVVVTQTNPG